jgi:hypothetical protein
LDLIAVSIGRFSAMTQRIHEAVVAEFADRNSNERVGAETLEGEVVLSETPAGTTGDDIGLVESQAQQPDADSTRDV